MLDKNKKEMIDRIINAIQSEANFIKNNDTSSEIKLSQMEVLLDVHHFLRDYEKNVKILNEYNINHRFDRDR